jgi:DNA topoisomerase I
MKTLIIVESPSKCKKIEHYLGSAYKVVASYGHFTKLDSLDQISFDTFQIAYKVDKTKVLKTIKEEIKKSKDVILATDDDREGEAIAWALCMFCKLDLRKTKKMVFQEITKTALLRALDNLGHVNMDRVKSQQARQILDIYLGYKVSPLLWKYVQHKLSAGRCQTPALRLVYENQKELENMSQGTHFIVKAQFTDKRVPFQCNTPVEKEHIDTFMESLSSSRDKTWTITTKKERQVKEKPPTILITSSLQQKAHQALRMSPKQTMKYAQELYENGFITYMRTDSACYSKDFISSLHSHIHQNYGEAYVHPHLSSLEQNKNKNKAQEAHEGIRVCDLKVEKSNVKTNAANTLYQFIYKHTIQCGMSDALYHETIFGIPYYDSYVFQHKDKHCTFRGWTLLNNPPSVVSFVSYLNILYESGGASSFMLHYAQAEETLAHSKYHYHEASLIQKLESLNIGRPSTYSSILSSILDKKYVNKTNVEGMMMNVAQYIYTRDEGLKKEEKEKPMQQEKNKLVITPLGKQVCEFCYEHFDEVFQYDFTEYMESSLDQIEQKQLIQGDLLRSYIEKVDGYVQETKTNYQNNPEKVNKVKDQSLHCGSHEGEPMYVKNGKFGYYLCLGKKDKISLKEFNAFSWEQKIATQEPLSDEERTHVLTYIATRTTKRNENICVELSSVCSIRKSKYGFYIFYQPKNKKKPQFLKYNDEKEDDEAVHQERVQWIEDNDKTKITRYIMKKYNITI